MEEVRGEGHSRQREQRVQKPRGLEGQVKHWRLGVHGGRRSGGREHEIGQGK